MSSSSVNQLNAGTANTDNEAQCFDIIPKEEVESTECIGFDLDLTLVDSSAGILETFKHILTKHGYITKVTEQDILNTIGIPLEEAFKQLGVPEPSVEAITAEYRAVFNEIALPKITLMPHARECLDMLKDENSDNGAYKLVLISARKEESVLSICDALKIRDYFDIIKGGLHAEEKGELLSQQRASLYVGDTPGDMIAAKTAKCIAVGVTTGYNDAAALRKENDDAYIISNLSELKDVMIKITSDRLASTCIVS
jgi:phosphoglycolate phosphatase-like HAD superfamily hydrolase